MLRLPTRGFAVSKTAHNVRLGPLVDWLEGCVVFADTRVSQSDVVDALQEEGLYSSQDFANERVGNAWTELTRRQKCLRDACPFTINGSGLDRVVAWDKAPAYAFCLMLSLQVAYPKEMAAITKRDYTRQGELFERLTSESLAKAGWSVHTTGWSRAKPESAQQKIEAVAQHILEPVMPNRARWTKERAKDAGLDVVCTRPFPDGWGGRPLYLVQCASGNDWTEKLGAPELGLWRKFIDFTTAPMRALAMPFAPEADEFRHAAVTEGLGLLLDRHRLVAHSGTSGQSWPSAQLTRDLNKWIAPRVKTLPKIDG